VISASSRSISLPFMKMASILSRAAARPPSDGDRRRAQQSHIRRVDRDGLQQAKAGHAFGERIQPFLVNNRTVACADVYALDRDRFDLHQIPLWYLWL
jgi:hypothetical protein